MADHPLTWALAKAVQKMVDAEKDAAVALNEMINNGQDSTKYMALAKTLRKRRAVYHRELDRIYHALQEKEAP